MKIASEAARKSQFANLLFDGAIDPDWERKRSREHGHADEEWGPDPEALNDPLAELYRLRKKHLSDPSYPREMMERLDLNIQELEK